MRPSGVRAAFAATAAVVAAVATFPLISSGLGSLVDDTPGLSALTNSPVGASVSNPPLSCAAPTIYNVNSEGDLYALNYTTRANSPASPSNVGTGAVNALAISANGSYAFSADMNVSGGGTTTVSVEDITLGTRASFPGMTAAGAGEIIAGGVDPLNGNYYYGGWNSAENKFFLFVFNPSTETASAVGTVTPPPGLAYDYGDLTFDGSGNMTLLAGSTSSSAKLLTVTASAIAAGGALPYNTLATITSQAFQQYVGIAFAANSTLYVETIQGELYSVNPNTGTITDLGAQTGIWGTPTDLASCTFNGSLTAQKNIAGRVGAGDQFTLAITGGGITSGNTGTTTGSSNGLQTGPGEVAGPVAGIPGVSYTATETAAIGSGANLANYLTTYSCKNGSWTVSSGMGTSTTFQFPSPAGNSGAQVVCTFTNTPASLSIAKATTTSSYSAVGNTISYSYTVTNTGPLTLTGVGVTDLPVPPAGPLTSGPTCLVLASPPGGCSGNSVTLASGRSATFVATYNVTQMDLDNGSVSVTAKASGTAPGGGTVTGTSNEVTVNAIRNPSISLTKSATAPGPGNTYDKPGQTIDYSYLVKNTGNVTLSSVNVTDPMAGLMDLTCPSSTLAPGASETCTATYSTTQTDVDNGFVHNTGTAHGAGGGKWVAASSSATVDGVQSPGIGVLKTAVAPGSGNTYSGPGQTIDYSYKVTNTGNVTLTSVTVTDPMTGLQDLMCPSSTLAPMASETCTATYTTTQSDVDNGSVSNTGTAHGSGGGKTVTANSSATVTAAQDPGISVVKTADVPNVSAVGQTVTYTFTVTNTGNVTLQDVGVTDAQAAPSLDSSLGPITCTTGTNGSITLGPGDGDTCSAAYTVTQADLVNGSITDTATADGTPPNSQTPITDASTLSLSVSSTTVTKSASPSSLVLGSTTPIVYTLTVTNTGTAATTQPIVVTDAAPSGTTLVAGSPVCATGGPPACSVSVDGSGTITWTIPPGVGPGGVYTLTFSVTANAADAVGTITNTGSWSGPGCGAPAAAGPTTCPTNTVDTPLTAAPATAAATTTGSTPTAGPTTSPAATTGAIAFTGALLSREWFFGVAALVAGTGLVLLAHRRRRLPKHAARRR